MTQRFEETLRATPAGSLVSFAEPVRSHPDEPITDLVGRMRDRKTGCALICEGDRLVGILTDRDVLTKVLPEGRWDLRAREVMTAGPDVIRPDESIADAIRRMAAGGYRHLPIVDHEGRPQRVLSVRGLVRHLVEHFPVEVFNLPPDPDKISVTKEGA